MPFLEQLCRLFYNHKNERMKSLYRRSQTTTNKNSEQFFLRFDRLLGSFHIYNCKIKEKTHNHLVFHTTEAHALWLNVCSSTFIIELSS